MSTIKVTYKRCNGCLRDTLHEDVVIHHSRPLRYHGQTIDICEDCVKDDKYICRLCNSVHNDDHPCKQLLKELEVSYAEEAYLAEIIDGQD